VTSSATVGKSRGAIASYEHVNVSGEIRAPFTASKPYATRGPSVSFPHTIHLGPAPTQKLRHEHE
jgi:hypothetical protein